MTEKKTYCFRWRCYHIHKAPPYKAAVISSGEICSITRSKAFSAALNRALNYLRIECPDLDVSNVPTLTRSDRFYRSEYQSKDFIYHVFMEDITK